MITDNTQAVALARGRYERYPYPHRDPADERSRLCATGLDDLGVVNFYCFGGRRNIRDNFRVLLAGGGTGDAAVYLAHQLKETNAEIVYMDLSQAAREQAQARARQRDLEHRIEWRTGDLLDLPDMDFQPFDYINCCSVLHHLADPAAGLAALRSVLKDDGGMGLKVYGRYGRAGVDLLAQLVALVYDGESNDHEMLTGVRALVDTLPPTNLFRMLGGVNCDDETEVFHNLVGANDRSFTVPELYRFVESAGLKIVEFTPRQRALYVPHTILNDPRTRDAIGRLDKPQQQAVAELLHGTIKHHSFWVNTGVHAPADLNDPDNVPFFSHFARLHGVRDSILSLDGPEWSMKLNMQNSFQAILRLPLVPAVRSFVRLIDDRNTMGEIVEAIRAEYQTPPPAEDVWKACRHVIDTLLQYDLLVLRHRSAPTLAFE